MRADATRRIEGSLTGTLAGDALGLPREGLTPARAARLFGEAPLEPRLFLGRSAGSDDTDHACMTAAALFRAETPERFARSLSWKLRAWLFTLPPGIGFATLRAILKLWLGSPPSRSGVSSAGNGPLMRAPVIGCALAGAADEVRDAWVDASTRLTHAHPWALDAARLVAHAAALASRGVGSADPDALLEALLGRVQTPELRGALQTVRSRLGEPPTALAQALGLRRGVTGFVLHTAPVVIAIWLRHPADFRHAVEEIILLGGDADSTAAILGGIIGASAGQEAVPDSWRERVHHWPITPQWIQGIARALAGQSERAPRLSFAAMLLRNLVLIPIVLAHGFRRLAPPY